MGLKPFDTVSFAPPKFANIQSFLCGPFSDLNRFTRWGPILPDQLQLILALGRLPIVCSHLSQDRLLAIANHLSKPVDIILVIVCMRTNPDLSSPHT